jgi:HNH endonuclease
MNEVELYKGYFVREDGSVRSTFGNGRILKQSVGANGRPQVGLVIDGKARTKYIHVLVCEAFYGPRPSGMEASHKDGNILNNHKDNLVWETRSQNLNRRILHGTHDRGFNNSRACLTRENVEDIHYWKGIGLTDKEIANRLGVSRTTVIRVKKGQRYADK